MRFFKKRQKVEKTQVVDKKKCIEENIHKFYI